MAARIQPGEMREYVTIQRDQGRTTMPDGRGGWTADWVDVATVPARIVPVAAAERLQAMALEASQDYQVTIRYRSDLTAAQRLVWNSTVLQILGPPMNPDQHREYHELICRAAVLT